LYGVSKSYLSKVIRDLLEAISVVREDVSKPFESLSRAERSEIRYYMIVVAEALIALAYHIVRRGLGMEPETPSSTFRILLEKGLMTREEFEDAVKIVRLRNLLVHRYWVVDDRLIYDNVRRDFRTLLSFVERIRRVYGV